jgi:hypothetical protein
MGTVIGLAAEAKTIWIEWYNATNRSADDMPEGPARAVAAKTIGQAARLILLLHLAGRAEDARRKGDLDPWSEPVSGATVLRATQLAMWLRNETLRVYHELDLVTNAVPPIMRFCHQLPRKFETSEAKSVAEQNEMTERTMYYWLDQLQERGAIEKIKRGLYRKR